MKPTNNDIPIYPGSSSFFPGVTPFGFFDYDLQFQADADKVATFCALRLGYPIVDVELQDKNFYTAFEDAIINYGNEVYAYKVKQDMLTLEGNPTGSSLNNTLITPNFGGVIRMSHQYGTEAGVGGKTTIYKGSFGITSSQQDYDLSAWALSQSISGGIEIKRVFYEQDPAILRQMDPAGILSALDMPNSGYGVFGDMMMPLSYTLQRINAIELADTVRRSNYSFELSNNKLRIFPKPQGDGYMWFEYIKESERNNPSAGNSATNLITNVSNVPYNNPVYSQINAIGRQWIFEYSLANCKEMLGYVRGKYQTLEIPDGQTTLNHGDLIASAKDEKERLRAKLAAYLEETSRTKVLERAAAETDFTQKQQQQVPLRIFIG
jgi:hypothetical protein